MKRFCEEAIQILSSDINWAENYVRLRMEFHRKHGHSLIQSTFHGADFFHHVLFVLNGGDVKSIKEPAGEYRNNFVKLVLIGLSEA